MLRGLNRKTTPSHDAAIHPPVIVPVIAVVGEDLEAEAAETRHSIFIIIPEAQQARPPRSPPRQIVIKTPRNAEASTPMSPASAPADVTYTYLVEDD